MYYHRVLPPLPSLPNSSSSGRHARRDALKEHRIMTDDRRAQSTDRSASCETSSTRRVDVDRAAKDTGKRHRSVDSQSPGPNKRSLSRGLDEDDEADVEDQGDDSSYVDDDSCRSGSRASVPPSGDTNSVCLCQPDPKVPRPRNAFILYRQHYQGEVARKHPKLANPEISKIIGEHWRHLPPETKEAWKALAEEEKVRHHKQYPNYRYQPRRGGRQPIQEASASELGRCPKCGGRNMSTRLPATPTGALPSPPAHSASRQPPPTPLPVPHGMASSARYRAISSPRTNYPQRSAYGSHTNGPSGYPAPYVTGYRGEENSSPLLSPEAKRRRYDSGYVSSMHRPGSMANTMSGPGGPSTGYEAHRRRNSALPRPDFMGPGPHSTPGKFSMQAPPPRPVSHAGPPGNSGNIGLTLAPLKIASSNNRDNPSANSKAVEAMVMSIPLLNKIRVLGKISPPLQPPSASSPPHPTRGAIIAVEGRDDEAIKAVVMRLREGLMREEECRVKLYYGGRLGGNNKDPSKGKGVGFPEWLALINEWHRESVEVGRFIITPVSGSNGSSPQVSPSAAPTPTVRTRSRAKDEDIEMKEPGSAKSAASTISPTTQNRPKAKLFSPAREDFSKDAKDRHNSPRDKAPADAMDTDTKPRPTSTAVVSAKRHPPPAADHAPDHGPMPVAIIPRYQLSLTDAAAAAVPIGDEYSPTDHWQWMATLWRGIVGPDITIVVRPAALEEKEGGAGGGGEKEFGRGDLSAGGLGRERPREEVEIRLDDYRAIVLRCEREGKVEEKVLRRVSFEVGEWLRGMRRS